MNSQQPTRRAAFSLADLLDLIGRAVLLALGCALLALLVAVFADEAAAQPRPQPLPQPVASGVAVRLAQLAPAVLVPWAADDDRAATQVRAKHMIALGRARLTVLVTPSSHDLKAQLDPALPRMRISVRDGQRTLQWRIYSDISDLQLLGPRRCQGREIAAIRWYDLSADGDTHLRERVVLVSAPRLAGGRGRAFITRSLSQASGNQPGLRRDSQWLLDKHCRIQVQVSGAHGGSAAAARRDLLGSTSLQGWRLVDKAVPGAPDCSGGEGLWRVSWQCSSPRVAQSILAGAHAGPGCKTTELTLQPMDNNAPLCRWVPRRPDRLRQVGLRAASR